MSFQLFDSAGLEKGLNACALRNNVIADNMANANTPGYVAKTVLFDQYMQSVSGAKKRAPGLATAEPEQPEVVQGGKVDIITEMASLAKNQILYSAYTQRISQQLSDLEWIIQNAGR